jgi:phenylalanyl-tRNA synthetase beta chain
VYKGKPIGVMGVVDPVVLEKFNWEFPVSMIEIDLEDVFQDFK